MPEQPCGCEPFLYTCVKHQPCPCWCDTCGCHGVCTPWEDDEEDE